MTSLILPYEREDAKTVVKATLELMDSIDKYADEGQRVVGEQEATVFGGNGAKVTVDIPEIQSESDTTEISVDADKNVSIDMSTNEDSLKSEFLNIINDLREKEIEEVLELLDTEIDADTSKEVTDGSQFGVDQTAIGVRFIIIFVLLMLFSIFFTSLMMP